MTTACVYRLIRQRSRIALVAKESLSGINNQSYTLSKFINISIVPRNGDHW